MSRWWEYDPGSKYEAPQPASDWRVGLGLFAWIVGVLALLAGVIAFLFGARVLAWFAFGVVAASYFVGRAVFKPKASVPAR